MKHYLIFEFPKLKVEIWHGDQRLASSLSPTLLKEIGGLGHQPIYYFDKDEVELDIFKKNNLHMFCYLKGRSSFWSFKNFEQAIWSYSKTNLEAKAIEGKIAFDPRVFEVLVYEE